MVSADAHSRRVLRPGGAKLAETADVHLPPTPGSVRNEHFDRRVESYIRLLVVYVMRRLPLRPPLPMARKT